MPKRPIDSTHVVTPLLLAAVSVQPIVVPASADALAQDAAQSAPAPAQQQPPRIRFNFKGQTYDQIL
ncbi:MAG: hypothetical protein ACO3QC_09800, partial [Phycisphaerales bacterium]